MPVYEYLCILCGHCFEREQKIKDEPLKRCPECDKPGLSRLIQHTGFALKGDGWSKDGYAGKKRGK